ncbi:hypothetical protein CLV37_10639 [Kineococcus rhizosphaerae]|uniref:Uncharacterized protein n=1 Tax=Kineococcus rhizosphaerae TaxID=559628 RepID=A0A2T0R380_9ACTN|nr:hypothetical protein CLV37_10639 [Kineococcus rhizosphaerae]
MEPADVPEPPGAHEVDPEEPESVEVVPVVLVVPVVVVVPVSFEATAKAVVAPAVTSTPPATTPAVIHRARAVPRGRVPSASSTTRACAGLLRHTGAPAVRRVWDGEGPAPVMMVR